MTVSGRDVLRAALRTRKLGLATIGRELDIPINALEAFVQGGTLSADRLNAIAVFVFGGAATYDETADLLRSANKQAPIAGGIRPPQFERRPLSDIVPPRVLPKTPTKLQPARPRRAGWAE